MLRGTTRNPGICDRRLIRLSVIPSLRYSVSGSALAFANGSTAPPGGDVYLLSHVIHDWTEDQCLTILRNCRQTMGPGSRLLIVEMVLAPGDAPHPGKLLDLAMLVMPGGQERTEGEYAALLRKAGLNLTRVIPTASAVCVLEAVSA